MQGETYLSQCEIQWWQHSFTLMLFFSNLLQNLKTDIYRCYPTNLTQIAAFPKKSDVRIPQFPNL